MYFHSFNIGYIDIPNCKTLNIYTVGCPHHCNGCHAKDLQDINNKERQILSFNLIKNKLDNGLDKINNKNFFQGICWLGGDPLYQWDDFIKINTELKNSIYKNLYNIVYTGYLYLDLPLNKQNELINCIDIIIDGPWKGITIDKPNCNQKIWFKKENKFIEVNYKYLENYFKNI